MTCANEVFGKSTGAIAPIAPTLTEPLNIIIKNSHLYRCVPNSNCEKTSTEEEVFGSSSPETTASCFDETPNGLQKFTESKTHTCCAEENINVGKRNEGSLDDYNGNFCQDHDNYR